MRACSSCSTYDAPEHSNVGVGEDLSIRELAEMVRDNVHPSAELLFDRDKPDGIPRKLLNVDGLHAFGWRHKIGLREGIGRLVRRVCRTRAPRGQRRKRMMQSSDS